MKTAHDNRRIGELPPRYGFALNSDSSLRCSKCLYCGGQTFKRKFALLIYIDEFGSLSQGLTCRYCTKCELIVAHQQELETQLVIVFSRVDPTVIGNNYLVLGTVEMKYWKKGLTETSTTAETMAHTAEFKNHYQIESEWC